MNGMNKIYIALSEPKAIIESLDNEISHPNYQLYSKEEILSVLGDDFNLLIVEEDYLSLDIIYSNHITKLIYYLSPNILSGEINKEYSNVRVYKTVTDIIIDISAISSNFTEIPDSKSLDNIDLEEGKSNKKALGNGPSSILNQEWELPESIPQNITDPYPQRDEEIYNQMRADIDELTDINIDDLSTSNVYEYQQSPLSERAIAIRKDAFSKANWDRNKTIGVWSPIPNIGVTTFVINFAIYLAQLKIPIGVVEALNNRQILKTLLEKYGSEPKEWHSFIETLYNNSLPPGRVQWVYKGVNWMPLGDKDFTYQWNQEALSHYLNSAKYFDLLFVDLPTGEMQQHTLDTLRYIDELWIIVDNAYLQHLSWKSYIHKIIEKNQLTTKLIFTNTYSFSKVNEIANRLELEVVTTLPAMHEECHKNHYEKYPLIHNKKAIDKLKPSYDVLIKELLGSEIHIKNPTVFQQILKRLHIQY